MMMMNGEMGSEWMESIWTGGTRDAMVLMRAGSAGTWAEEKNVDVGSVGISIMRGLE